MIAALPGLREIRSALAGGYLWLFLLWLLFDPSLGKTDFVGEPFRSAHHVGEILGPVAKGVATTFAAYLLGTFVNEGRNVMSRLYLYARQSENFTPDVARSRLSQRLEERIVTNARRHRQSTKRKLYIRKVFEQSHTFKPYQYQRFPPYPIRMFIAFLALLERLNALVAYLVRGVALALAIPVMALEVAVLALLRSIIAMRTEPYRPFLTKRGVISLETYLESAVSPKANAAVPGVADVIADFPVIRTRLIHTSVDTVNEVDRLSSEAEFRSSIVAPLSLLIGLLAVDTSLWWLLLWPLFLTLLFAARERRRESGDLLVDALYQGVVTSPSIDAYSNSKRTPRGLDGTTERSSGRSLIW